MRFALFLILGLIASVIGPTKEAFADEVKVEKLQGRVYFNKLTSVVELGQTLKAGDTLITGRKSAAELSIGLGNAIIIGPNTKIAVGNVNPLTDQGVEASFTILKGYVRFAGDKQKKKISFKSQFATVKIDGTVLDIFAGNAKGSVFVEEGEVEVDGIGDAPAARLGAGENLSAGRGGSSRGAGVPDEIRRARRHAESLIGALLGVLPEGESFLRLMTNKGDIRIKLRGDLAPEHVAHIRRLARKGSYEKLRFARVIPGTLVQTDADKEGGLEKIRAETSKQIFTEGTVGMVPGKSSGTSTGHFFIILKTMPHLSGRFSIWGEVVEGMDVIKGFAAGQPPKKADWIDKAVIESGS